MTIEINNWVKIKIDGCPVPSCPHCLHEPYHLEFDGRVGKLHDVIEDTHSGCDCYARQMAIPLTCFFCEQPIGTLMSSSVEEFGHRYLVEIEGIHTRFSSSELEDLGSSLEEHILKENVKVLT